MAKRQPLNPCVLNFETGEVVGDDTSGMRSAQNDLYRLDNPYVGNKRKIVVDIAKSLDKAGVEFETMADVFSGSSVVGLFFKLLGKKVRSNDLLTSSYMNAVAFVENPGVSLTRDEIDFLCNNDNKNKKDFVRTFYSERFTPREALFLDNYKANIDTLIENSLPSAEQLLVTGRRSGKTQLTAAYTEATFKKALIKHALAYVLIEHHVMNRCFLGGRLNSGQILAKLEHRLQHQRNDGHEMSFKLSPLPLFPGDGCEAFNMDCLDFLELIHPVDLCYVDPPYGGSQSDYASMFAFCEEYVYGRLVDALPHLANSKKFVSPKDFETHFREVLVRAAPKSKTIAVSFNDSSWADADHVQNVLRDYKKDVAVVNMDYEYKYRKNRGDATEYLFIAR